MPVRRLIEPAVRNTRRRLHLSMIIRAGFFDQEWYEAQRGQHFRSKRDAILADYLRRPRAQYLSPHPLFEPSWLDSDWARRPRSIRWCGSCRRDEPCRRSPHPLLEQIMNGVLLPVSIIHSDGLHLCGRCPRTQHWRCLRAIESSVGVNFGGTADGGGGIATRHGLVEGAASPGQMERCRQGGR